MNPAREYNLYIRAFYYHEQVFWLCRDLAITKKTDLGMPFQDRIGRHILPIPPAPAVFDQRVIDVGAIRQKHFGNRPLLLVEAVSL